MQPGVFKSLKSGHYQMATLFAMGWLSQVTCVSFFSIKGLHPQYQSG